MKKLLFLALSAVLLTSCGVREIENEYPYGYGPGNEVTPPAGNHLDEGNYCDGC